MWCNKSEAGRREGGQQGCVIQYSTGAGAAASVVNHFPRGPVPWVASGDIIREIPSWVSPWRWIYSSSGGADTQFDLNNQTFSNQIHNKQTFRNEYPDTHQSYHDTVLRTVVPEERAETSQSPHAEEEWAAGHSSRGQCGSSGEGGHEGAAGGRADQQQRGGGAGHGPAPGLAARGPRHPPESPGPAEATDGETPLGVGAETPAPAAAPQPRQPRLRHDPLPAGGLSSASHAPTASTAKDTREVAPPARDSADYNAAPSVI